MKMKSVLIALVGVSALAIAAPSYAQSQSATHTWGDSPTFTSAQDKSYAQSDAFGRYEAEHGIIPGQVNETSNTYIGEVTDTTNVAGNQLNKSLGSTNMVNTTESSSQVAAGPGASVGITYTTQSTTNGSTNQGATSQLSEIGGSAGPVSATTTGAVH